MKNVKILVGLLLVVLLAGCGALPVVKTSYHYEIRQVGDRVMARYYIPSAIIGDADNGNCTSRQSTGVFRISDETGEAELVQAAIRVEPDWLCEVTNLDNSLQVELSKFKIGSGEVIGTVSDPEQGNIEVKEAIVVYGTALFNPNNLSGYSNEIDFDPTDPTPDLKITIKEGFQADQIQRIVGEFYETLDIPQDGYVDNLPWSLGKYIYIMKTKEGYTVKFEIVGTGPGYNVIRYWVEKDLNATKFSY